MGSSVSFADLATPDEQFVTPAPPTSDRYTAMLMSDDHSSRNPAVFLEAKDSANHSPNEVMTSMTVCKSLTDAGCDSTKYLQYVTVLNHCDAVNNHNCIVSVTAQSDTGTKYPVEYLGSFPKSEPTTYTGDSNANLPNGGSSVLINIPDLPHAGGTQYLVTSIMSGFKTFNSTKFQTENFQTSIYAVSEVAAECTLPGPENNWKGHSPMVAGWAWSGGGCGNASYKEGQTVPCVQMDTTGCLVSWPLPQNVNFGVQLKLSTSVLGWLHGRLSDVQANISQASDSDQLISIQGKPVAVPGLFAAYKKSELPNEIAAIYASNPRADSEGSGWGGNSELIDGNPYSILKGIYNYDEGSFKEMLAWVDSVGNKATLLPTIWSFRSISKGEGFNNCSANSKELSGIVTTNSTMYIASPPTFDTRTRSLQYKVAAPHFTPQGDIFRGVYNLAIKSDFARCLYGFTSAPVSASVTVVGVDGQNEVATTAVSEHDGWMYLKAAGFTFSSPTISVKLSQTSSAKTNKISITCIRAKTVLKVVGSNPKCPAGYTKK